jgi:FkbM family methyltransferase
MNIIQKVVHSARQHFKLFGINGLIRRALIIVPGTSIQLRAQIPNSSVRVILRLGTTDVAAFEHVFVNEEYGFTLAQMPSVIIDAGANVGMSAVYFSNRYPNARIIAVEPDPSSFSVLKKNAELYPNIIPVNAALWNSDSVVSLQDSGGGSWGMRVSKAENSSSTSVRSMTFATLLSEYDVNQVDVLKVDIEGAECELFEDASVWINQVKVICAELHDRFRPGCSKIFEWATSGFHTRWQRGELCCVAREGAILIQ